MGKPAGFGLLDILPGRASRYDAICALMQPQDIKRERTVFCGDSGNDLDVLQSPLYSVLVRNSRPEVRAQALEAAQPADTERMFYIAKGEFQGMSGNYSGGMLEGIAYFYPSTVDWIGYSR